jgi:hypothetical protein
MEGWKDGRMEGWIAQCPQPHPPPHAPPFFAALAARRDSQSFRARYAPASVRIAATVMVCRSMALIVSFPHPPKPSASPAR